VRPRWTVFQVAACALPLVVKCLLSWAALLPCCGEAADPECVIADIPRSNETALMQVASPAMRIARFLPIGCAIQSLGLRTCMAAVCCA